MSDRRWRCGYVIEERRYGRVIDYTRRCHRRVKGPGERCWQHKDNPPGGRVTGRPA